MTETATTASSMVTCSLYISLAWAGGVHMNILFSTYQFSLFVKRNVTFIKRHILDW